MKNFEIIPAESMTKTAWAVDCPECGKVFMTQAFYEEQPTCADKPWLCPRCFSNAEFDNANWEVHFAAPLQKQEQPCPNCNGTGVDKGTKCLCQE